MLEWLAGLFRDPIKSLCMVGSLQVLDQALPAHGDSFFHHHCSLPAGKGVSFEGVTGVSKFNPEPFVEVFGKFVWHFPCPIKQLLYLSKSFNFHS